MLKSFSGREPQSALSQKGTWENEVVRDVPCDVEMHLQDSDNFLETSAVCEERSKGGQKCWEK